MRFRLFTSLFVLSFLALSACRSTSTSEDNTSHIEHAADADSTGIETSPNDFYIIPGQKAGMITATSSEESLRRLLGSQNVLHDSIYVGEGQSVPGTILFKGTPNETHIIWQDTIQNAIPEIVRLKPAANPGASEWLVQGDVRVGSTLQEVERANGKPFLMSGFGWDYGGTVTDWKGGKLAFSNEGLSNLSVVFTYDYDNEKQQKLAESVMGDSEFASSEPPLYELNPRVESITIRLK